MIKAVIFDLGGVLLRTTDLKPREQLAARLGMSRAELEQNIFGGHSGDMAQKGEITAQQHWSNLAEQMRLSEKDIKKMVEEFFAYDEIDFDLIDWIHRLQPSYKTGLLSNAFDDLRQIISERWHFENAFDDMVISAEVGLVKPDSRIYHLALEGLGVKAEQAVFVDDMQSNIEGARRVGMMGIRFHNPEQVKDELLKLLNGYVV
jgi:epoxide hydrolase-like predicted phosphatase